MKIEKLIYYVALVASLNNASAAELICTGTSSYDGDDLDGESSFSLDIDAMGKIFTLDLGGGVIVQYPYAVEPNRYFHYFDDEATRKLDAFFEINRTSLDFRYMRVLKDTAGREWFVITEGKCSFNEPKI